MTRRILLDLLAAVEGAQVTRASAFVERFAGVASTSRLVVLKNAGTLEFLEGSSAWDVVNVRIGGGSLKALRRVAWQAVVLPRLMKDLECDVYLTFSHFLPRGLPRGVRSVVGVSNLAPFSRDARLAEKSVLGRLKLALLRRSILSSARRATRVIALSETCREVLGRNGLDISDVHVIPNGVERQVSQRPPGRAQAAPARIDGSFMLCVSHFYRYKNFQRLVEAYALLPERLRRQYRLVLVGRPYVRPYYAEINARIADLKLEDRVVVIPGLDHDALAELYARAQLFVFPSLIENCPMSLLEAMSYGLPLVSADIAPMPEFAGDAASYFDPFSAEDCARAIEHTLDDEQRLEQMRSRSLERAKLYSWDAFGTAVANLCLPTGAARS